VQRAADPVGDGLGAGKPSSSGRWRVVEQFERDGFCYRLTRRPAPASETGPRLTKREEEALAYACAGYGNKAIATVLGVSPSTVGVLLYRAAAKMGAKSRQELVVAYARLKDMP
jgi:DNA-binding CsgD family transcriptional regulator